MVYSDEYRSESSRSNTVVGSIKRLKETKRENMEVNSVPCRAAWKED